MMKRWFTLPAGLATAMMLALPAGAFAQDQDGPPQPPPIDQPADKPAAGGAQDDIVDILIAPDAQDDEQKVERKEIVKVLQDQVDRVSEDVQILLKDAAEHDVRLLADNNYWIGVVCESCDENVQQELGIQGKGLIIKQVVEESPAEEAGLKVEDILVTLGDEDLVNNEALSKAIVQADGKKVYAHVIRAGEDIKVEVQPGKRNVLHVDNVQGHVQGGVQRLHQHLLHADEDHDIILHTIKEKPGQSFSYQVVRPGVITTDLLKVASPGEVEVIELEGKIKAIIQGDKAHDHDIHVERVHSADGNMILELKDGQKLERRVISGVHTHDADDHDEDSASDAKHEHQDMRIELTQKDGEDANYVIVLNGKKYEVKGDNLDDLPKEVRDHVKILTDGKFIFGVGGDMARSDSAQGDKAEGNTFQVFPGTRGGMNLFRFRHDDDADHDDADHDDDDADDDADGDDKHVIRRSYNYSIVGDGDDDNEQHLELRIEKQDDAPAKIIVKKGDKTWTVDENKLDELPEEVRGKISVWHSKDGDNNFTVRGIQGGDGNNVFKLKQGENGVFRVFGNSGEFKFEPKGEFKFEVPHFEAKELSSGGTFKVEGGQLGRLRLAPGSRYFVVPDGEKGAAESSDGDADLAAKIEALNKEIKALRKAIEKLSKENDN